MRAAPPDQAGTTPDPSVTLAATVRHVVARQLRVAPDELTDDLDLTDDLGLDDSAAQSLVDAVGECLDVRFPDDFLDGVYTYADLTSAVCVAVGS
jgi:acyl carrier protein